MGSNLLAKLNNGYSFNSPLACSLLSLQIGPHAFRSMHDHLEITFPFFSSKDEFPHRIGAVGGRKKKYINEYNIMLQSMGNLKSGALGFRGLLYLRQDSGPRIGAIWNSCQSHKSYH